MDVTRTSRPLPGHRLGAGGTASAPLMPSSYLTFSLTAYQSHSIAAVSSSPPPYGILVLTLNPTHPASRGSGPRLPMAPHSLFIYGKLYQSLPSKPTPTGRTVTCHPTHLPNTCVQVPLPLTWHIWDYIFLGGWPAIFRCVGSSGLEGN